MAGNSTNPGPRDQRGVMAGRIVEVARTSFAENGWAGTTVRAIARSAGVDPALVYHYFASKEGLLEACTTPPAAFLERIATTWASPPETLGASLVTATLHNWEDSETGPVLRAIVQIAAHEPSTRAKLRDLVARSLMGPARIGSDRRERTARASLIASQLLGLGLMRYVWQIEPLASMSKRKVVDAVGPTIQRYIDGNLGPTQNTSPPTGP